MLRTATRIAANVLRTATTLSVKLLTTAITIAKFAAIAMSFVQIAATAV